MRPEGVAALGLRRQAGLGFALLPLRFPWPDPANAVHGKLSKGRLMSNLTHLYIIEELSGGFFKIGITGNVIKRANCLQTGNPRPLTPRYKKPFLDRGAAREVERAVHIALRKHAMVGEWFSCSLEEAVAAVEAATG